MEQRLLIEAGLSVGDFSGVPAETFRELYSEILTNNCNKSPFFSGNGDEVTQKGFQAIEQCPLVKRLLEPLSILYCSSRTTYSTEGLFADLDVISSPSVPDTAATIPPRNNSSWGERSEAFRNLIERAITDMELSEVKKLEHILAVESVASRWFNGYIDDYNTADYLRDIIGRQMNMVFVLMCEDLVPDELADEWCCLYEAVGTALYALEHYAEDELEDLFQRVDQ